MNCPASAVHPDRHLDKVVEYENNTALYHRLILSAQKTGVRICVEKLPGRMNDRLVGGVCSTCEEACRCIVLWHLPKALHGDMLKYIGAARHDFKNQILSE